MLLYQLPDDIMAFPCKTKHMDFYTTESRSCFIKHAIKCFRIKIEFCKMCIELLSDVTLQMTRTDDIQITVSISKRYDRIWSNARNLPRKPLLFDLAFIK